MKQAYWIGGVILAVAAAWYFWPKTAGGAGEGVGMEPEVSVVTMKAEPLSLTKDLPGRTSAYRVAEIRPQVNGIIQKRLFQEGGDVKEGEPLYQIDPAPYMAAYNSAKAELQKAEANVKSVEAKASRYDGLVKIGGISKQEFDDVTASLAQARADVAIARASVATAKINLDYTKVLSPISGRIGQSKVTEGALVNANQNDALAVVQQLEKIYVDVSQSSEEIIALRRQYEAGTVSGTSPAARLVVDGKVLGEPGTLQFSDISVNPTTGTVLLRVVFPNSNHEILPGMFVHARLEQWKDDEALLVPQKSVSREAGGGVSVWVIGADTKAQPRAISVTEVVGDKWLVSKGLASGEKVVLEGIMKLQPGIAVKAVEAGEVPAVSGTAAVHH